jgi:hypothetical protein
MPKQSPKRSTSPPPACERPTDDQIENAELMGWVYHGDGIFSRGDRLGWYTVDGGFYKA